MSTAVQASPSLASVPSLSPTERSTVVRGHNRAVEDRAALLDVLDSALICHLGVEVGEPGQSGQSERSHPLVLPTAFAYDLDGPDRDGTIYVHGSVASRSITASPEAMICLTLTVVDGLVAARSGFHHSMNYRSAVILGTGRLVTDAAEKRHALDLIVDHMIPGRTATLREPTRKELVATSVVALPLHEASVKVRAEGPVDEPVDVEAGVWGGVIPIRMVAGAPVPDPLVDPRAGAEVPADVRARAAELGAR